MKEKKVFLTEIAYLLGVIAIALGASLMVKADLGISMVVAPSYLLHLWLVKFIPFYSFGTSEYIFQAFLLILLVVIIKKFKKSYLFSFVSAVIYGFILDGITLLVGLIPNGGIAGRLFFYVVGMVVCSFGVACMFHTYISPAAYELFVKEFSEHYNFPIHNVKTVFDCSCCILGVLFSFAFFGFGVFEGVKWGTVICALLNGRLIGFIGGVLEKNFDFKDGLKLRKYFEQ